MVQETFLTMYESEVRGCIICTANVVVVVTFITINHSNTLSAFVLSDNETNSKTKLKEH